jgi:thiol-disulfide isomerase/thioredoxin
MEAVRAKHGAPLPCLCCYNALMDSARSLAARHGARSLLVVLALLVLGIAFTAFLGAAAARQGGSPAGLDTSAGFPALFAQDPQGPAPEFPAGVAWLNSPPLTLKQLRGKVVLVDFWEYTCVNCIRTLPYVREWDQRYRDKGLVVIGVHTPEFAFAKQVRNVRKAAAGFGLKYPIAVDSDYKIWNAYHNQYWPAKYLIDKAGIIRATHFGEGDYGNTEAKIQALLKEIDPGMALPAVLEPLRPEDSDGAVCYPSTPELYAGSLRGDLGSPLTGHGGTLYQDPSEHEDGILYPQGAWVQGPESLLHARQTASPQDYVALKYHALGVNAVLKPERGKPIRLEVEQDGKPVAPADRGEDLRYDSAGHSYVMVDQPRMYRLVKNAKFGTHEIKLLAADEGLGLYSYTFTSCTAGSTASFSTRCPGGAR